MNSTTTQLEDVYVFRLIRAAQAFKQFAHRELLKHGIDVTSDQWLVLKCTSEKKNVSQRELAKSIYKDPASITRIVDVLVKKGLVERKPGSDRRMFEVALTKAGEGLVQRALPVAVELREHGIKGLSNNEFETFKKALNVVFENYRE